MLVTIGEKTYSTKTLKFVRAMKGAGNKVMTKINNAGLSAGEAIGIKPKGPKFRFTPKSSHQLNRETVAVKKKAQAAVASANRTAQSIAMNPGGALSKGVETTIRKPLTVAGTVSPIPGGTFIGMGAEKGIDRVIPAFKRGRESLAGSYARGAGRYVEGMGNALIRAIPV